VPEEGPRAEPNLAGARASVLARLWGALAREPLAGLAARHTDGDDLVVKLPDGRTVRGAATAARPFAAVAAGFALDVDGVRHADPATLLLALRIPGATARLGDELDNSVANLALARAAQARPDGGEPGLLRAARQPDPLAHIEQCVVDGHPLHPCCRTRMGLSRDEVLAYAPEHRPVVHLDVFRVPPARWLGVNCPPRLVVHPWQRDHVLDGYPWLQRDGGSLPARPLMSLRTLASVADPRDHVKTAVDVQMTSAVRTVSPAAIHNGPLVSALLHDLMARTVAPARLAVVPEVAAGAVLVDGEPCRSLAMVRRRMPDISVGEVAIPLAALAAPSPAGGRPFAVEVVTLGFGGRPLEFVDELAGLLLSPLLTLLHLGVALEAHGQNTLVVVRGWRPVRLLYRDMGGLRISPSRLRRHGVEAPRLRGDITSDDPQTLRTKLFAALFSTVVGELVAVLGREYGVDDDVLWARVAAAVRSAREGLPVAAREDVAAIFADTLPVKAMTAMRLAADPLEDQWARLPNPMAGLA